MQRVVVVSSAQSRDAFYASETGAAVVVVDDDSRAAGSLVRDLVAAGGRAVAFVGAPGPALDEMIAELFPEFEVSRLTADG